MAGNDDYANDINPQAENLFKYDRNQKNDNDPWLNLEIYVRSNQPKFLQGLDQWLKLDLISEAQVKKICRNQLICVLPEIATVDSPVNSQAESSNTNKEIEGALVKTVAEPNIFSQVWLRFLDELSIRWLLFLGIFLVVVSSGVLAASQWNNFPRFAQYLILLAYTLCFWSFGLWSGKQENLKLTSQTLNVIATLLIPINFWAISHFSLGNNLFEWVTIAVAFIALTSITYGKSRLSKSINGRFCLVPFMLLSWLHLGWQYSNFSLYAVYGGIITIILFHYKWFRPLQKYPTVNLLYLFGAWSLLLTRALIASVNTDDLIHYNLAIAFFAWLLGTIDITQIDRGNKDKTNQFLSRIWQFLSVTTIFITWLLSIIGGIWSADYIFWQTVGVSLLAIHLFSQRLTRYWRKRDLTAIFFIGLQTLYISKELIPDTIRSGALDLAVEVSKTEYLPESVFGVTLFPYIILFIFVATWLYRQQKTALGEYSEWLTLILGIGLTCLSLSNPAWRSLNFLLSTITLGYVTSIRQPIRIPLVHLTHFFALVTVTNAIDVILPNLNQGIWGSILVLVMILEWGVYVQRIKQPKINQVNLKSELNRSLWYGGLVLTSLSYVIFLGQFNQSISAATWRWGLIWLAAPGLLTLIAKYTRSIHQRRLAVFFSCIGLICAQVLVLGRPETRFVALGAAIALMFVNVFNLRRSIVTIIHVGFGLSFIASLIYSLISTKFVSDWYWLPIGGLAVLGLYQLRISLTKAVDEPKYNYVSQRTAQGLLGVGIETQNFKLVRKYIQAVDYWAIAIIGTELILLSLIYFNLLNLQGAFYFPYLITTGILPCAIIWRYSEKPNYYAVYTQAWLWGFFAAALSMLWGNSSFIIATINIILGLLSFSYIARLSNQEDSWARFDLAYIPLIYAVLAIFWRLQDFHQYTGLISLGAAFICLNTRQRDLQVNQAVNYFGFAGISLGVYELVIYQIQQSSGGNIADGLTILALVAGLIAVFYRLAAWFQRQQGQSTLFNLNLAKVILIAHIHWAISSIFKVIAAGIALETIAPRLTIISIITSLCLGTYAVIQGKDQDKNQPNQASDWWVYIGLVEIAATLVYGRLIIDKLSLFDPWRVVFTCAIALIIYQIPWQNFGWRTMPWQRTALIMPALMALVTAEDISFLGLGITAAFYLRIAYYQNNLRWSYISVGLINWGIIRLVWQYNTEFIWLAAIVSLSILYIAQFDPYFGSHRRKRHQLRLFGSIILCLAALFYQEWGIIPGIISFTLIFLGLGFKVRAFLFTGTITLITTAIYQLIILVLAHSFLKWIVGLITGIASIAIAAGFERKRDIFNDQLQNYGNKLKNWQ